MATSDIPPNASDKMIRSALKVIANLRAFLMRAIPDIAGMIDFDRPKFIETEFLMDDWRGRESDLLVELTLRTPDGLTRSIRICILIEHQSDTDYFMPLRTFVYAAEYWDRQWRNWKARSGDKPPFHMRPLIPIVLYTNTIPWGSSRTLADLFPPENPLSGFAPKWEPIFWELGRQDADELLAGREAFDQFLAVVRSEDEDADRFGSVLRQAFEHLQDRHADERVLMSETLRMVFTRAMWQRPENEQARWTNLANQTVRDAESRRELTTMGKRAIDEVYERGILKGREEGREEGKELGKELGKEEGRVESLQKAIIRMGRQRFGVSDPAVEEAVRGENDLEKLDRIFDRAISATGWDGFLGS